jgi:hypothetical protein
MYDDQCWHCADTHAILAISIDAQKMDDREISKTLGLEATGTSIAHSGTPDGPPVTSWRMISLCCKPSRDAHRHLDWLLDRLAGKENALCELIDQGCFAYMALFWQSAHGHGGPTLSLKQLSQLAKLGLELRLEFWPPEPKVPSDID